MKLSNMIARTLAMLAGVSAALAAAPPPGPDRPPRVPHGFQAVVGTAAEPYGKTNWAKEIVEPQSKIELVFIPAGEFTMGSDANERWQTIPRPAHRVRISRPFYFGKYTVTQKQWKAVFGGDAGTIAIGYPDWTGDHYEKKGNIALSVAEPWRNFKGVGKSGEFPACAVPWILAVKYCQALLKLAGGTAVRLPTEAEFEYALRAGTTTRFFWGDDESKVDEYAWVGALGTGSQPRRVGQKKPNPWGLYDINGNVWQWCSDWCGAKYYEVSPKVDPQGPERGDRGGCKACRGGEAGHPGPYCRAAYRSRYLPDVWVTQYGLRVVVETAEADLQ